MWKDAILGFPHSSRLHFHQRRHSASERSLLSFLGISFSFACTLASLTTLPPTGYPRTAVLVGYSFFLHLRIFGLLTCPFISIRTAREPFPIESPNFFADYDGTLEGWCKSQRKGEREREKEWASERKICKHTYTAIHVWTVCVYVCVCVGVWEDM